MLCSRFACVCFLFFSFILSVQCVSCVFSRRISSERMSGARIQYVRSLIVYAIRFRMVFSVCGGVTVRNREYLWRERLGKALCSVSRYGVEMISILNAVLTRFYVFHSVTLDMTVYFSVAM